MRYPEGGGLTAKERAGREQVRFAAAQMFAQGANDAQVARRFHVTTMSANRWHRAFDHGGLDALASQGPGGATCKLDEVQLGALEAALDAGPAAHGYLDQCWTCARISELIARKFGISYTVRGVAYLLHRLGWSPQVPTRRAAERDEEAITAWKEQTWPVVKKPQRTWAPGCALKTKPVRDSGRPRGAPGAGAD
jgi:transposase